MYIIYIYLSYIYIYLVYLYVLMYLPSSLSRTGSPRQHRPACHWAPTVLHSRFFQAWASCKASLWITPASHRHVQTRCGYTQLRLNRFRLFSLRQPFWKRKRHRTSDGCLHVTARLAHPYRLIHRHPHSPLSGCTIWNFWLPRFLSLRFHAFLGSASSSTSAPLSKTPRSFDRLWNQIPREIYRTVETIPWTSLLFFLLFFLHLWKNTFYSSLYSLLLSVYILFIYVYLPLLLIVPHSIMFVHIPSDARTIQSQHPTWESSWLPPTPDCLRTQHRSILEWWRHPVIKHTSQQCSADQQCHLCHRSTGKLWHSLSGCSASNSLSLLFHSFLYKSILISFS